VLTTIEKTAAHIRTIRVKSFRAPRNLAKQDSISTSGGALLPKALILSGIEAAVIPVSGEVLSLSKR
jgi:hypothetical protein